MATIYDFKAVANNQIEFDFATLQGKTLLIVNTASKCGFTSQYDDLEKLYRQYKDKGLVVLGFPCDQFAHQEPGSDADIAEFCRVNHGVTFPLMSKIDVNGKAAHPIFTWLKQQAPGKLGSAIKWNFTKFLVEKDGLTVHRYAPSDSPLSLIPILEEVL
ncbi:MULTISPECIES: glutathione peroxidase [unclassified Sphaerochaeta]|jgi:glutathione peroxidase|uniref:glutathione peroxidase n=1 Tax=unclassified Sphaerochaeta TaxID=2637943 RepID=UPI000A6333CB|nr:glutathione peroxidase [Sphaerochaeta sp. UBA5856]MCK9601687.1 glutathione peroxidase [Sphaerochaeta sp.]HPE93822.1 glutathione peroxidase [Sphaerochaeta sp.]